MKKLIYILVTSFIFTSCIKNEFVYDADKHLEKIAKTGNWNIKSGWIYVYNGQNDIGYVQDSIHYEFCDGGTLNIIDTTFEYINFQGNVSVAHSGKMIKLKFLNVKADAFGNQNFTEGAELKLIKVFNDNSGAWGPEDYVGISYSTSQNTYVANSYYTLDVRKNGRGKYALILAGSSAQNTLSEMIIKIEK